MVFGDRSGSAATLLVAVTENITDLLIAKPDIEASEFKQVVEMELRKVIFEVNRQYSGQEQEVKITFTSSDLKESS